MSSVICLLPRNAGKVISTTGWQLAPLCSHVGVMPQLVSLSLLSLIAVSVSSSCFLPSVSSLWPSFVGVVGVPVSSILHAGLPGRPQVSSLTSMVWGRVAGDEPLLTVDVTPVGLVVVVVCPSVTVTVGLLWPKERRFSGVTVVLEPSGNSVIVGAMGMTVVPVICAGAGRGSDSPEAIASSSALGSCVVDGQPDLAAIAASSSDMLDGSNAPVSGARESPRSTPTA